MPKRPITDAVPSGQKSKKSRGGGNTNPPLKKDIKGKRWCFTLNNYTVQNVQDVRTYSKKLAGIIFSKEVGENGTPHLQGYMEFKSQTRMETIKKGMNCNHVHLEKAKGNREDNIIYCSKDGEVVERTFPYTEEENRQRLKDLVLVQEYKDVVWKPFQKDIIEILNGKPHPRSIIWCYEETGCVGKSYLCKYLGITMDCIKGGGKKDDVLHQTAKAIAAGKCPKVIIMDCPRKMQKFFSYTVVEMLKNGDAASGKYEGSDITFPIPHVIVFANEPPAFDSMSMDRWDVRRIDDGHLVSEPTEAQQEEMREVMPGF